MKGDNAFAVQEQHVSWTKAINCVFSPSFSPHPNKISSINRVSYEWLDCVWASREKKEREESGSIFPMIKMHSNCFDSIEDLGGVRAKFGADRGWHLHCTDTTKGFDWYVGARELVHMVSNKSSKHSMCVPITLNNVVDFTLNYVIWFNNKFNTS